jgi:catechol 2,3-dioxygenase-like lactoylglutathione lyase family enzyme
MHIDHVGLTVADLDKSVDFFVDCLGWGIIGHKPSYPAVYLGHGQSCTTLWQVADPQRSRSFDRQLNVGLHHLALRVDTPEELQALHAKISAWEGVAMEFDPEPSGGGPKVHCMFLEPGGCRIELCWDPRK